MKLGNWVARLCVQSTLLVYLRIRGTGHNQFVDTAAGIHFLWNPRSNRSRIKQRRETIVLDTSCVPTFIEVAIYFIVNSRLLYPVSSANQNLYKSAFTEDCNLVAPMNGFPSALNAPVNVFWVCVNHWGQILHTKVESEVSLCASQTLIDEELFMLYLSTNPSNVKVWELWIKIIWCTQNNDTVLF